MSASSTPENDRQWADDFRQRCEAALQPVVALMTEAKTRGFDVQMNFGVPHGTQVRLMGLKITKDF